jgi:hypothetical protein
MKFLLPSLFLAGVSLLPAVTAATTVSDNRAVDRTVGSLLKARTACFTVERDQATSDRCAERINSQISALADTAVARAQLGMTKVQFGAWKSRQTALCKRTIPFDRGGSGFGEAMDSCVADATARLIRGHTPLQRQAAPLD